MVSRDSADDRDRADQVDRQRAGTGLLRDARRRRELIATMFITERAGRPLPEDGAEPSLRERIA